MAVFAVGVGPGSPDLLTREAEDAIRGCDVVIGYGYTLGTIEHLTGGKDVRRVTMADQDAAYLEAARSLGGRSLAVPFTGDASFSESEVVDRLVEVFGDVTIVPGISAVQVAAARSRVPLDRARVITMHVTGDIEGKKEELRAALAGGSSAILVPRPWPGDPSRNFMPSEAAAWLRGAGVDTAGLRAAVYERLTTASESRFEGTAADMEGREFSDMCVVVFDQHRPEPYTAFG